MLYTPTGEDIVSATTCLLLLTSSSECQLSRSGRQLKKYILSPRINCTRLTDDLSHYDPILLKKKIFAAPSF